jgi:hypothetical protein
MHRSFEQRLPSSLQKTPSGTPAHSLKMVVVVLDDVDVTVVDVVVVEGLVVDVALVEVRVVVVSRVVDVIVVV